MAQQYDRPSLTIHNAELLGGPWRNFRGEKQKFNVAGARNFNIELSQQQGEELATEHWNVKPRRMGDEDTEQKYALQIKINFESRNPPQIWMITSAGRMLMREDMVADLDHLEVLKADVAFVGHRHGMNSDDPEAMSAYLTRLYVTIYEDPLDLEYAHIPQVGGHEVFEHSDIETPF